MLLKYRLFRLKKFVKANNITHLTRENLYPTTPTEKKDGKREKKRKKKKMLCFNFKDVYFKDLPPFFVFVTQNF